MAGIRRNFNFRTPRSNRVRAPAGVQENPLGTVALGALAGAVLGGALTFTVFGGPAGEPVAFTQIEGYEGAVLLMPKSGLKGELIDALTGARGYSHTALDLGWLSAEGEPLIVESVPRQGARVAKQERPAVRIPLSTADTEHARGAALAYLRARTGYRGTLGGKHCTDFVLDCLPRRYSDGLPWRPTPNDLARAWLDPGLRLP